MADLAPLLEVVEPILLGFLVVGVNLSAELLRVLLKDFLLFLFNASLLLFNLLLFLDDAEELISFLLGLFSKTGLSLEELALTSILHILKHFLFVLQVPTFLLAGSSLSLFEGSLRS